MSRTSEPALPAIHSIRSQKVVSDSDLARLYGVSTKALNQAIRRNRTRFPADFCFQLTAEEFAALKSQTVTSKGRGGRRHLPLVFTEHGALMAATVLNSTEAVQMSVYLIRAFVRMREEMLASAKIIKRLAEIDRRLVEHDSVLREIIERLQPLLDAPEEEETPKPRIGYHQGNR